MRKSDFVSGKRYRESACVCRFVCEHTQRVCVGGGGVFVCARLKIVCVYASVERYCVLYMTKRETD